MMRKILTVAIAAASVLGAASPALAGGEPAGSGMMAQPAGTVKVCGLSDRAVQQASGGIWVLSRANAFDTSGQALCIAPSLARPGFTILNNLAYTGAWQAYPFTGYGCAYSLCSRGSKLPVQVRKLPAGANTSFSWRCAVRRCRGSWNASYDIWFDHRDQVTTEDNGAELMIWLRPNPGYRGGELVHIGKHWYWFVHWRTHDKSGIWWNYIQFRFTHVMHGVQRLLLAPFLRFTGQRGLINPAWWLTSIHAGYEIVSGGRGLQTTWFNAHV